MAAADVARCKCGQMTGYEEREVLLHGPSCCLIHFDACLIELHKCASSDAADNNTVYLMAA